MYKIIKSFKQYFLSFVYVSMGTFLAFLLVFILAPRDVYAFAGGDGTQLDPYQITSCTELQDMMSSLSSHYILNSHIDCSDTVNWNSGAGFEPVGNGFIISTSFSGSFNGNGKVISNLYINRPATNLVGMFGITYGGNIYDVGMENVTITGAQYTGGLIGHLFYNSSATQRGTLQRVYTTGTVTGTTRVGGIVGEQSLGDVVNSYSRANVTGTSGS